MASPSPRKFLDLWVSGQRRRVSSIELYPEPNVVEWRQLMARGTQQVGTVASTGLGFFGSPGWVIPSALALGTLEGALTSAVQREGLKALQDANRRLNQLRSDGRMVAVEQVSGLDRASPLAWIGTINDQAEFDPRSLTWAQLAARKQRPFDLSSREPDAPEFIERKYLAVSDEFLTCEIVGIGRAVVRWEAVEFYSVAEADDTDESGL